MYRQSRVRCPHTLPRRQRRRHHRGRKAGVIRLSDLLRAVIYYSRSRAARRPNIIRRRHCLSTITRSLLHRAPREYWQRRVCLLRHSDYITHLDSSPLYRLITLLLATARRRCEMSLSYCNNNSSAARVTVDPHSSDCSFTRHYSG